MKKKIQNQQRSGKGRPVDSGREAGKKETACPEKAESPCDEATLHYIQMVTSLVEGRQVPLDEIREMVDEILRQHSIPKREKIRYPDKYPRRKPK